MPTRLNDMHLYVLLKLRVNLRQIFLQEIVQLSGKLNVDRPGSNDCEREQPLLVLFWRIRERRPLKAFDDLGSNRSCMAQVLEEIHIVLAVFDTGCIPSIRLSSGCHH